MTRIVLDPDGSLDLGLGLLVLVEAPTGVTYLQQCAGGLTEQRSIEGYVIPVGGHAAAQKVYDWFWSTFRGTCYMTLSGSPWTPAHTAALASLVGEIPCWRTNASPEDIREFLRLDESRMHECVEAWIPVVTPYGAGILTLANSD
jgi:hypothetical protein